MFKTRKSLILYLLLVAAMAAGLLWHQSRSVPQVGRTVSTGDITVGGPFQLTDQNGQPRASTDFRDQHMLIYFGYSFCPDVCPTTLAVVAEALDKMGADAKRIAPVFITVDPGHDTPAVLKDYMAAFGPRFVGLTGSKAEIAEVQKVFRVFAKEEPLPDGRFGVAHSNVLYLMGPDGKLVEYYDEAISPDDLAKALREKI